MALEHSGRDAVVVVERLAGTSAVTQRISLGPGAESLAISTAVDWKESEKLLKLGFALDVRADRSAAETQFGHVFRPTHLNTSWEAAKFEICAHRWIHVAEPGYGVAISNSSTYGHDVTRNIREGDGGTTTTVRLSLLRAPKFPDPGADRGRHELNVTIRPGASIADAVEEGYRTNLAPRVLKGAHGVEPLVTVSNPALVVEAVKLAEDGSGDVIVRVYESLGERSAGLVTADFDVKRRPGRGFAGAAGRCAGRDPGGRLCGTGAPALPVGDAEVRALRTGTLGRKLARRPKWAVKQAEWERSSRTATTHPPNGAWAAASAPHGLSRSRSECRFHTFMILSRSNDFVNA